MPHPFGPPSQSDVDIHSQEASSKALGEYITLEANATQPGLLAGFYIYAAANNLTLDPFDVTAATTYLNSLIAAEGADASGAGRVEFASERGLREAQTAGIRVGALQNVDQERRLRIAEVLSALINAAPRFVGGEDEFFPGLEPGGAGDALGRILGANVPNRQIPTQKLPLSLLLESGLVGGVDEINASLPRR